MFVDLTSINKTRLYHLLAILAILLMSVYAVLQVLRLRFNYDFEAFFPNQNNELVLYEQHRETFDYDNEFILIGIENSPGIFRKDFLMKVSELTERLRVLPDVRQVHSPANLKTDAGSGFLPLRQPVLHPEREDLYAADSARIYQSPWLVGSWFPANAKSVAIYVKTANGLGKVRSDRLGDSIRQLCATFHFEKVHLAGRIFAQEVYLRLLQTEFLRFISLAFLLVLIFLWFSFRSLHGLVLPLLVVSISVVWTFAIMYWFGKDIDLMTSILPTMIFIAGLSDVVHYFSKYFEEAEKGRAPKEIQRLLIREVAFPTFLTMLTTVVAFLSLLFSGMKPIREFGIYTSVGIVIAFILTYTLLPALLYFFPLPRRPKPVRSLPPLGARLGRLMIVVLRNQRKVLVAAVLLLIVAVAGITRVRQNNILLEDLSDDVAIKQDFDFFDREYSGARPLEIHVEVMAPGRSVLDYQVMQELDRVEKFIRKEYQPGFLVSAPAVVRGIYHGHHRNDTFPQVEDYEEIAKLLQSNRKNRELRRVVASDGRSTRFSAKIRDIGSNRMAGHNENFRRFIRENTTPGLLSYTFTGAGHLIDRNNEYMVTNMLQGFLFSVITIGLLTFFLHRSWRMVLVFIIPNVIPLVIIAGLMGYAGIELKASTALIFSIAFGIATDDTIHFISRFRIERLYGKSLLYAFKRTYLETGRPVVLTTFVLFGGFFSLMSSSFQSIYYFGFLICITVLVALLCDLLILPGLLLLLYGNRKPVEVRKSLTKQP